jgi:Transcriptional regulator, AbiEi antitoxin/Protein of unknown function (DUF559)
MANESAVTPNSCGELQSRSLDRAIAELAERQHGVVARRQLLDLGLSPRAIEYRLTIGRLHPVHRGVYAVGHSVLSVDGLRMAAVLAGGERAVLSGRAAGSAWAIWRSSGVASEVTAPRGLRSRGCLRFRQARLPADEITTLRGIPITTVPRTLFDLAAVLPRRQLTRAIHEAEVERLWDRLSLHDLIARYPRARGTANLRAVLRDREGASEVPRDEIEDLFIAVVRRFGLPMPSMGQRLQVGRRWFEPDCVWERQKLIVELDGRQVHGTGRNFESDRARDRALVAAGWLVVRLTWRQLCAEPGAVAADLSSVLAAREPPRAG